MYVSYALAGILESAPSKGIFLVGTWRSTAWIFIVKANTNIEIKAINFVGINSTVEKHIIFTFILIYKQLFYKTNIKAHQKLNLSYYVLPYWINTDNMKLFYSYFAYPL